MTTTRLPFKKIGEWAILGMAVSIASGFYFLTLPFLVVLAVCRMLQKDSLWQPSAFREPTFFLPAALYLYALIQAPFSHDKGAALSTLSTNLPFLLYSLILGTYGQVDRPLVRRAEKYFLFSIVGSLLFAILYAVVDTAVSHQNTVVLGDAPYSKFSSYGFTRAFNDWHPTNVAMAAVQGVFIVFRQYGDRLRERRPSRMILPLLIILFLVPCLFMLNSVTAILAFTAILLYSLFVFLSQLGAGRTLRLCLLCLLVCGAGGFLYLNPLKIEKIEMLKHRDLKVTDHYEERNVLTMRMAKWQTHMGIIRHHLLWGTTEGDIKQVREAAYKEANFQDLALHNYNAHDQFIEYLAIYGIPGFALFVAMLLAPLRGTAYRRSYTGFIMITCIIFLTESLLERQQGLSYFMFFYALYATRPPGSGPGPGSGDDGDKRWNIFGMPSHVTLVRTAILLLSGVLLSELLYNRSLWLDEAMLALNIVQKNFSGLLHPLDNSQVAPIAFLWIEKCFTGLLGNGEIALRLFPFICSVLSLVLVYHCSLALTKNRYIALIACCLLGFSPKFIYYASEVKQYATDLAVLLSIYLVAFSDHPFLQKHRASILSLTGAAAIFLSNIAVIPLYTAGLWLLYRAIREGKERRAVITALPLWAICFGINYMLFIYHHPTEQIMKSYWAASFMPLNHEIWQWLGTRIHQVFYELLPHVAIANAYILNIILYAGSLLYMLLSRQYRLLYLCVAPVLLHLCLSALKMYPFDLRLILYQLPLYVIVLANGIYRLAVFIVRKPVYSYAAAGVLTAAFALQLFRVLPVNYEEIRPVILSVNKNVSPEESAYVYYGGRPAFQYYKETGRVRFGNIPILYGGSHLDDTSGYAAELRDTKGHVWVLFSHVYPFDGSRGEERYMVKELLLRGRLLKEFEAPGSAAYLIDLW